jgi:hydroxyethylthiazole kinase-like uncharacterized protein yjeF
VTRHLTDAALRARGLPQPDGDSDKEGRGNVLVVAGSREVPGAALLTATAALRAGAGRLTIAAPGCIAMALGLAVPEARVIALPETAAGGPALGGIDLLARLAGRIDAAVIGPGLMDEDAAIAFTRAWLKRFDGAVVLDAYAMGAVDAEKPARANAVLTPHAGEMAHLTGLPKETVADEAEARARAASDAWRAGVVLKGATTWIAFPGEPDWCHGGGDVGLATSGSGDTLAGLVGGLAARGVPLLDAALWGVRLHALAGERLAARHGRLGYLARELGEEVPAAMHALCNAQEPGGPPGS